MDLNQDDPEHDHQQQPETTAAAEATHPKTTPAAEATHHEELQDADTPARSSSGEKTKRVDIVVQRQKSTSGSSSSSMSVRCPTDDGGDSMTSSMTSSTRSDDHHSDVESNPARRRTGGDTTGELRDDDKDESGQRELQQSKQRDRQQKRRSQDSGVTVQSPRPTHVNGGPAPVKESTTNSVSLEVSGRGKTLLPQKTSTSGTAAASAGAAPLSPSTSKPSSTAASETTFESDEHIVSPFGKAEPKFEPRFSHYKANTVEGIKWDTMHFVEHRKKIAKAKPIVDNKPPPNFTHVHVNMKKMKLAQDRQDVIDRDNKLLLGRLVKAMTTTRIDNWNDLDNRIMHSSRSQQRRNILQVAAENQKMVQRLTNRKSTVWSSAHYARRNDDRRELASGHHQRHLTAHRSAAQRQKYQHNGSGDGTCTTCRSEERRDRLE